MRGLVPLKSFSYTIVALAIFLPLSSCDLIDSTCKKTPDYKLCDSIIRSDPRAAGADVNGLALIAVDYLKSKSYSALQQISQLLFAKPELKVPLTVCQKKYNFIIEYDVTEAVEALTKGNPKFAEEGVNDATNVVQECENGFKSTPSPIADVNAAARRISVVASAIIKLLL